MTAFDRNQPAEKPAQQVDDEERDTVQATTEDVTTRHTLGSPDPVRVDPNELTDTSDHRRNEGSGRPQPTDRHEDPIDSPEPEEPESLGDDPRASDITDESGLTAAEYIRQHNKSVIVDTTSDPDEPTEPPRRVDAFIEAGRLLNADKAEIDPAKVTEYALNPDHPVGGNKARVFDAATGFNRSNASELLTQLREGVKTNDPTPGKVDDHGARFTVDIPVDGPTGSATVRTGWIYSPDSDHPRLVTLYVK